MTRAKDISKIITDADLSGTLDVTGTVTAGGLTVNGDGSLNGTAVNLIFNETDTTDLNTRFRQSGALFSISTVNDSGSSPKAHLVVNNSTGDISFYEDTGTTPKFFWDSSTERLGIGTASPTHDLQIQSTSPTVTILSNVDNTSRFNLLETLGGSGDLGGFIQYEGATNNVLELGTVLNGTDTTHIYLPRDGSGNVGIGGIPTTYPLEVFGGIGDGLVFKQTTNSITNWFGAMGSIATIGTLTNHPLGFYTNGSERMRVLSDGTLLYGDPTGTPVGSFCDFVFTLNQARAVMTVKNAAATATNQYGVFMELSGDPNDTTRYFMLFRGGATERARIQSNGDMANVNNSFGALSDEKLKEQIIDASSQWDDIKALRVRKYKLKQDVATGDSDEHWRLGVVAQEVEASGMSGLVSNRTDTSKDEDGNIIELDTITKHVKYSVLYMKAVKALQEAITRIEALETANTALQARITALETA